MNLNGWQIAVPDESVMAHLSKVFPTKTHHIFPSLAKVEEEVNPARFFRVNRKILASIDSVQKVSRFPGGRLRVQLKSGSHTRNELISPVRRTAFLDWLGTS